MITGISVVYGDGPKQCQYSDMITGISVVYGDGPKQCQYSDMITGISVVQTEMKTIRCHGILSHSDNLSSSLQRAELSAVDVQKNAKLSAMLLQCS